MILFVAQYNRERMTSPPRLGWIVFLIVLAVFAMAAGVYFAGIGRTPLAMIGALLFVVLGGLAFELARRRSNQRA